VKVVLAVVLCPPALHVTLIGQVSGVVLPPTSHDHDTAPLLPTVFGSSPRASDGPLLYVTTIEQFAPGAVCTFAVATLPR